MRAGVAVSVVGHIGFVLLTMLAWEARTTLTPTIGSIVPIEIVDVAAESNVRALAKTCRTRKWLRRKRRHQKKSQSRRRHLNPRRLRVSVRTTIASIWPQFPV